ncbi:VCBS repeat-containing protein [Candidatus Uhrbacteria bacterium]|nr:VCBS repeat-containing protein [Candidatus Uhrbacteria bacterium]
MKLPNNKPISNCWLAIFIMVFFGLPLAEPTQAFTDPAKFPRLANYYLRAGTDITSETVPLLARYDLLVLPAEAQIQNPNLFSDLRSRNPDIVILAYVPTVSFNYYFWRDRLHLKLLAGISDEWWLRDTGGNKLSFWPGTEALNISSDWVAYLSQFVHNEILSSGLWDGVFYDEVDDCISCRLKNIDLNQDGLAEDATALNQAWQARYQTLFSRTRSLIGSGRVILINGSSTPLYQPYINGRLFESFPTPWEGAGRWEDTMQNYARLASQVGAKPAVLFLDGDSGNSGRRDDWADLRFGLTSTLLGGGYFGYDFGTQNHGQLWWYDEYDAFLGRPLGEARNIFAPESTTLGPGVWRRDFDQGIVVVNATAERQTIPLREDFEKLHGSQDPITNDGSIISRLSLNSRDGLILLRVTERLMGVSFSNGAFSRILNKDGQATRTGFFVYDNLIRGGENVILLDLDGNESPEAMIASGGRVEFWNEQGGLERSFAPYGTSYHGPIHLAVGDVNGDEILEIITGAGLGGGPHVRVFRLNGQPLGPGFFAFDKGFRGGVTVAAGDLDGDGADEIVTGLGPGGLPLVRAFSPNGSPRQAGFLAYDPRFRGGVRVAAGDLDGDGQAEIVTGAGPGGGPHVRVFRLNGQSLGKGFFPYDSSRRTGVAVGVTDLDGDGQAEIVAFTEMP